MESQSKSKQERRAKLLLAARQALEKHESAPATIMIDKDWIETSYDGFHQNQMPLVSLKTFEKNDAIIPKLQSLERDWKSYSIPCTDSV